MFCLLYNITNCEKNQAKNFTKCVDILRVLC
nr:MAG TPA: hypothetical protein [Bacteriophage sp.]